MERLSRRRVLELGVDTAIAGWVLRRPLIATDEVEPGLQTLLDELIAKYRVPGAVVALALDGKVAAAAAGVANLNTGMPMTVDTAFLAGSITKVWTASLVMTFVDDGTIALDRPLVSYLPHLKLTDADALGSITPKQLLNHSSGIDAGDYLVELGQGPEAHRRYVELLATAGQIHRPGAYSSYCNGGFILAGHLLEHLTGKDYHTLLHDRIIAPLGLTRTVTDCADAILQRTAVGSLPAPGGGHVATPKFLLPRSAAPAGATLITTVQDLLGFADCHLGRGLGRNGARVLSEASAVAMATRTIGRPVGGGGFGLGWGVAGRPGETRLSHSGGSNGGISQLVAFPERKIAYASFANSSVSYGFHNELQQRVLATVLPPAPAARSAATPAPVASTAPFEPARCVGTYRRKSQVTTILQDNGRIISDNRIIPEEFAGSEIYNSGQQMRFEVVPTGPTQLTSAEPVFMGQKIAFDFLEPGPDGRYVLMYSAGRLARRSS